MATLADLEAVRDAGEPLTLVTAYDTSMAQLVERSSVDMLLVGDSLGVTTLGYDGTDRVTVDEMVHHAAAVRRAVAETFVVVDLPFGSYNVSPEAAVEAANRLKKEGGADAVKLEGGAEVAPAVEAIVDAGIPVIGHLGLTPQTASAGDGMAVQADTDEAAEALVDDARAIDEAGAAGVVLELVAGEAAAAVTEATDGFTLGVGAGPDCDGQAVTLHDLFGLMDLLPETVAGIQADFGRQMADHLDAYDEAVSEGSFPGPEATPSMREGDDEGGD